MKSRTVGRRALRRSPMRVRLANGTAATVTNITLPRILHRQVKRTARQLNWTFAEVVRAAVEEWLARHAGALRNWKEDGG